MNDRTTLTENIRSSIAQIDVANGYATKVGTSVLVGQRQANETETPCIVLTPGAEAPADNTGASGSVVIDYTISAYSNRLETPIADMTDDPYAEHAVVDAMLADIRKAVEGDGQTLCPVGGARSIAYAGADPVYHEGGGEICGVTVRYNIATPMTD